MNQLFDPGSIAVIGASSNPQKIGYQILVKLLESQCLVYPVNPKHQKILGQVCYQSIMAVPVPVNQAIIVTPAASVPEIVKDCLVKSVQSIVIISAGFSESGPSGLILEGQIPQTKGIILGPNCLGYANPSQKLDLTFAKTPPPPGNITLISQSGAIGSYLFDWAKSEHLGFSKFVSFGNRLDINENDLLNYLKDDPGTKVIGLYLESFADGKKFLEIASQVSQIKPVVVIFGGQTRAGKQAALSHTAALSPETAVIKTALNQAGCIQAHDLESFTDLLEIFSLEPPLTDNDLVIVTNAGGPGILAADKADEVHLKVERPTDVLGDALAEQFNTAFQQVIKDKIKDAFLIILTPQTMTQLELTCQAIVKQFKHIKKPIVVSLLGGEITAKAKEILRKNHIATIDFPQKAVDYLSILFQYWHNRTQQTTYPVRQSSFIKVSRLRLQPGRQTWQQIKTLAKIYHLPLVTTKSIKANQLLQLIKEVGFPLVLKVDPAEALHRTENKALFLNLNSIQAVKKHFNQLNSQFKTILIQPQIRSGHELFLGLKRHPGFPPLLSVGSGGIYTEIYQDIAHTFLPINKTAAIKLLAQTKIGQILQGARGLPPVNLNLVIKLMINLSQLALDLPQIQEIDINPAIINQNKIDIVDIKIKAYEESPRRLSRTSKRSRL